jgi:hypothetical protein
MPVNIIKSNILTKENIPQNTPKLYVDGIKRVEDYGDYVVLKAGNRYMYKLYTTHPKINSKKLASYKPLAPFLGKYPVLYYEPDEDLEELLTCFADW